MEAVASVILNRANNPRWWGRDIISVCRAPWQFSVWNPDDLNLPLLLAVDTRDRQFATALEIGALALAGGLVDRTNGADHYHTRHVQPLWSRNRRPVAVIGNHHFFRLEI